MADTIQLALLQIAKYLPHHIEYHLLSQHSGIDKNSFRILIRQDILKKNCIEADQKARILNLDIPPRQAANQFISITHTSNVGLWISCGWPCGVDVEKANISQKVVERVSTPEEILNVPESLWSLLWTAKESAFKAAQNLPLPPNLMSQIEITNWKKSDHDMWLFQWRSVLHDPPRTGRGAATLCKPYTLSISVVSSQL